ncbi:GHKL domain-containing protein [Metabacillus sp. KIGAM252]|uniref:GHKL domain-containing protein n=1 Tax=Metabacillus flavus TaxID=2823519 RepID=A0ABS5LBA8_9BACI|nr:GHKL domain-containing protein [Metabacillus flavus]MBS2967934.1 GHKL domain-containing protein [Metabacillus flavus]
MKGMIYAASAGIGVYFLILMIDVLPLWAAAIAAVVFIYAGVKHWFRNIVYVQQSMNGTLTGIQLLLAISAWQAPIPVRCLLFLVFSGLEYVRFLIGKQSKATDRKMTQLLDAQNTVNETFRVVRSQRHDYMKHISAVHYLLEKGRYSEAKEYMNGLVRTYEETNISIKGEDGVAAGILHDVYRRADSLGIQIAYEFDLPISTLPMHPVDLVGLLGNMLSNAIEACEESIREGQKDPMLTVRFEKRSGVYLLVCRNSSVQPPNEVLDVLFEKSGRSTKGQEGLGTKVIADTVKQYGGFLDFTYKEHIFTLKLKFPSIGRS